MSVRRLLALGAFPLLALGTAGVATALAGDATQWSQRAYAAVYLAFIVPSYAAIALIERVIPYRDDWRRPQGDVATDATHLVVTGPGSNEAALLAIAVLASLLGLGWNEGQAGRWWPSALPLLLQVWLAVLVAELGHYWFHRLCHETDWLWRLHAVHHSAPRLYWLNATRFHPLDLAGIVFFQVLPLVLLGIPPRVFLLYSIVAACYGQLQHCNAALRAGPWRWVFSTPELHRWHHAADSRHGNANYGAILSAWDLVFGTFALPRGREATEPIGIAGMPQFPATWLGQITAPFRWSALRVAGAAAPLSVPGSAAAAAPTPPAHHRERRPSA